MNRRRETRKLRKGQGRARNAWACVCGIGLSLTILCATGCGGDGQPEGPQVRTVSKAGNGDFISILECISASNSGDTCLVEPGTYAERIRFPAVAITVRSSQGPEKTIIDGRQAGPVVEFSQGQKRNTVLEGFTILNGYAKKGENTIEHGGGIQMISAGPTIENCILLDNWADGDGGGIYCFTTGSSPEIRNVVFQGNVADSDGDGQGQGGGLCALYGAPEVTNCLFFDNQAAYGGAISARYGAWVVLNNCTIAENAAGQGWALYVQNAAVDTLNSIYWNASSGTARPVAMDLDHEAAEDTLFELNYVDLQGWPDTYVEYVDNIDGCLKYPNRCTTRILISDNDDGEDKILTPPKDPRFVPLSLENPLEDPIQAFYLSQQVPDRPDQIVPSPCVNAGKGTAEEAGLEGMTTRTDGVTDTGVVDLGYHYPATM
jgi:predicted outer membrane repeat protein